MTSGDLGLLEEAGMEIGEFQVKPARLPVLTQERLQLVMLIGGDLTLQAGVYEGFKIHDRGGVVLA